MTKRPIKRKAAQAKRAARPRVAANRASAADTPFNPLDHEQTK